MLSGIVKIPQAAAAHLAPGVGTGQRGAGTGTGEEAPGGTSEERESVGLEQRDGTRVLPAD